MLTGHLFPHITSFLSDSSSIVRSTACYVLSCVGSCIESCSEREVRMFLDYLFPALSRLPSDPEEIVKLTYASQLAQIATTARQFAEQQKQDTAQADGEECQEIILKIVIDLLSSGSPAIKRALLGSLTKLCIIIGKRRVNNELLPHLITVLNEKEWQCRAGNKKHKTL